MPVQSKKPNQQSKCTPITVPWECVYLKRLCSRIGVVKLKPCDNNGELVSPISHHDTTVHPKKHATAILAQINREMAGINECDHHWEGRMEVSRLYTATPVSTHLQVECSCCTDCVPCFHWPCSSIIISILRHRLSPATLDCSNSWYQFLCRCFSHPT
jgi:hypothetical protein